MSHFINQQIIKYLELKGKTQVDIARLLGYTKGHVNKKLYSDKTFNEKQLEEIGKLLNAPFADMARNAVKMAGAYPVVASEEQNAGEEQETYGHQSRAVMALKMNIAQLQETKNILVQELGDLRRLVDSQERELQSLRGGA